jgi:hypothetical protein
MTSSPLLFAFGVHIHQPVGNFDHVIDEHVREAYAPFLERLSTAGLLPRSSAISMTCGAGEALVTLQLPR